MSYRGPALQYRIRKTTVNNKTGDNYSITIPRVIAEQFTNTFFRISFSGNQIIFESGGKLTIHDIENEKPAQGKRFIVGGGILRFN